MSVYYFVEFPVRFGEDVDNILFNISTISKIYPGAEENTCVVWQYSYTASVRSEVMLSPAEAHLRIKRAQS